MLFAVSPQQSANLPDVASRSAVRTAAILALAVHGKLNNVVGPGRHSPAKLDQRYGDDCEPNLTDVGAELICAKTETCVDITDKQAIAADRIAALDPEAAVRVLSL